MECTDNDTASLRGLVHVNRSRLVKGTLVCVGSFCVALGVVGIIMPLLPTTPFLLLAAACYAHSSEQFYVWLLTNRLFGHYIRDWRENRGIAVATKVWVIAVMLGTMGVTAIFFIPLMPVRLLLFAIGMSVSYYIWRQPTKSVEHYEEDTA